MKLGALPLLVALGLPLAGQDDPLTGVWEGRGKGTNPMIPPEGFAFTLFLEKRGEDGALATITMEGVTAKPAEAEFDAETGELAFRCDLLGILVDVELVLEAEEVTGKASGLGMAVELTGKRTSRDIVRVITLPIVPADLTTLTSEAWREDLAFLAENLPKNHANAFHTLTRADWDARVRALEARIPELTPAGVAVGLAQLVAAVGDAHTELGLAGKPFGVSLPVRFGWFADGLFVTAVDERFGAALAARVVRIGKASTEDALRAVCTLFASENAHWPRVKAPGKLAQPALLHVLGLVSDAGSIPLVVAGADGAELAVTIDGSGSGKWLHAPDPALIAAPLWQQRTNESYWFTPLASSKAVYVAYNRCAEDPARPMEAFLADVFAALESTDARRLVLDLRHNGGGNSNVLTRFVPEFAAHPRLAAPGSLRVLIGPKTFSAAMHNAQELRDGARARLIGEPTGGKPNSYGEVRIFGLPRSGLAVFHSTQYSRAVEGDPPAVEPDVLVPFTSADAFAGADPALERALAE
jgi:hypothetical protein